MGGTTGISWTTRLFAVPLVAAASAAHAQPAALGGPFAVGSYTSGMQFRPSVCRGKNDSFVVVFSDRGLTPPPAVMLAPGRDGSASAIVAARFAANASPLGSEFVVNSYSTGDQGDATVACNDDGAFLVAWRDFDLPPDGGRDAIFARAYDPDAEPEGPAFRVDFGPYPTSFPPEHPSACNVGSEFVVVWGSTQLEVNARRFASDGTPIGGVTEPDYGAVGEDGARCCGTGAGGFVVVWNGYGSSLGGDGKDVLAQRFEASGDAAAPVVIANGYTIGQQRAPALACNGSGEFVVAWTSDGGGYPYSQDGDDLGVFAQRFGAAGAPVGNEIQTNTYTSGGQIAPTVGMDAAGRFVVAWQSPRPAGETAIAARAFEASGEPSGTEFRVTPGGGDDGESPALGMLPIGDFAIVWEDEDDGDFEGIAARRYEFAGGETTTTSTTTTTTASQTTTTGSQPTTTSVSTSTTLAPTSCGDPVAPGQGPSSISAADALFTLRASVGLLTCDRCVCDVDSGGSVSASDALAILRFAVGSSIELVCPPC